MTKIQAPAAWDLCNGSSNVVVGVVDTGVDYLHQDLAANMWHNPGEIPGNGIDDDNNGYIDDVYGWDFGDNDNNPKGPSVSFGWHGTHCAGTIGAVGNNSTGVVGVCWNVRLAALKIWSDDGSAYSSDEIEAFEYAMRMGFRLTSNSWESPLYDAIMDETIAEAGASNVLFVAAAGNGGDDQKGDDNDVTPIYPASYTNDNVIAVAATTSTDNKAAYSNYGRTSVDLGAPGSTIYSTKDNNLYVNANGTSMACPHVAGACALAGAWRTNATAAQIKAAILGGTDPVNALSNTVSRGRLNLYKTLRLLGMTVSNSVPANGEAVTNQLSEFTVTFTDPYDTNTVDAAT